MLWLDEYERKARLIPGLLTVMPVAVLVVALGLRENPVISIALSILSVGGGPVILANYVRQRGLAEQEKLYEIWGGRTTNKMLRHDGNPAEADQRERFRAHLCKLFRIKLPTAIDEKNDPENAEASYSHAISLLIGRTRDKKDFSLLFTENKNYGYERNMLAMKPVGALVSLLCCAILILIAVLSLIDILAIPWVDTAMGACISAIVLLVWLIVPNKDRVKRIDRTYTERLAEAAWSLEP